MKRTFALICALIFLSNLNSTAQSKLNSVESRIIRNLIKSDTTFVPGDLNLQLELFKFNPNLIYKYRLDSLQSTVSLDYNSYVQTYIDVFLNQRRGEVGKMVGLGEYYFPIFDKALKAYQIPEEFKYLPIIESSMNPLAVSRVGATGLWQFMYTTGKVYGLTIDNYVDERRDPIASSYAAAAYLRDAYNDFGDWLLALASYNCGKGNVSRAIIKAGGSKNFWDIQPYLPMETRNYVPAFIAANYIMNYYDRYPDIKVNERNGFNIDSVYVTKYLAFNKIADALNMDSKDLQILNPSYKKDVINGSSDVPKRLIIPKIASRDYAGFFNLMNGDEDVSLKIVNVVQKTDGTEKEIYYQVKKGENLTAIAKQFKVEVQDVLVWNDLKTQQIVPGQKLVVGKTKIVKKPEPKSTYLTYKVKAGDSLNEIADRFEDVTIKTIKELNNLKSSILTIGMLLKINKN